MSGQASIDRWKSWGWRHNGGSRRKSVHGFRRSFHSGRAIAGRILTQKLLADGSDGIVIETQELKQLLTGLLLETNHLHEPPHLAIMIRFSIVSLVLAVSTKVSLCQRIVELVARLYQLLVLHHLKHIGRNILFLLPTLVALLHS